MIELFDTVIVPARAEGFQKVFIEQQAWWSIAFSNVMVKRIKFIAIYQVAPISAITHYAKISRVEKFKDTDRYAVYFDEPATAINPIRYDAGAAVPQSHRYTTFEKLTSAKKLSDILSKKN